MNLDDLFRFGDVEPTSVRLPAFSDDLNQSPSEGGIGNVRDAIVVGFHVQLELFVFLNDVLFDVFQVNAGIFYGSLFVAAGNFDGDARLRIGLLNLVGGLGLRGGRILSRGRPYEQRGEHEAEQHKRFMAESHGYLNSILHGMAWLGQVSPSVAFDANVAGGAAWPLIRQELYSRMI